MEPKFVRALAELFPHGEETNISISVHYNEDKSIQFICVSRFHPGAGESSEHTDRTQGFNIHYAEHYKKHKEQEEGA